MPETKVTHDEILTLIKWWKNYDNYKCLAGHLATIIENLKKCSRPDLQEYLKECEASHQNLCDFLKALDEIKSEMSDELVDEFDNLASKIHESRN